MVDIPVFIATANDAKSVATLGALSIVALSGCPDLTLNPRNFFELSNEFSEIMPTSVDDTICYSLPSIKIEVDRLRQDYDGVASEQWINQNRYQDVTTWKGISLYSVNGRADDLRCANRPNVKKTPVGERCPYICDEVLSQFGAKPLRVAFYRLTAGANVGKHKDYGQNRTMGMVRIHIPIITNEKVTMALNGTEYHFGAGEAWYFDASCWHSVRNASDEDRIHLIADFEPSKALDAHLKPVGMKDRIRFMKARMEAYYNTSQSLTKFMGSKKGRDRIWMRLNVLSGRSRAQA